MAGESIGKGALTLTTDATQLQSGLAKAQKSLEKFGASFQSIFAGGVGIAGISKLSGFIQRIGDEAESTLQSAEVFGMSADQLQRYQGAAQLAGIQTEKFTNLLRIASEKAEGNETALESLQRIFQSLSQIENKAERVRAASDIFGAKNSIAALKAMNAELERGAAGFNNVVSDDALRQMDEAADRLAIVKKEIDNMATAYVAAMHKMATETPAGKKQEGGFLGFFWNLNRDLGVMFGGEDAIAFQRKADQARADQAHAARVQNQAINEARQQANEMQRAADGANKFQLSMQQMQVNKGANAANSLLAPDRIEELSRAFEYINGVFAEGYMDVEVYNRALKNVGQELAKLTGIGGDVRLPSAVIAGSREDISASIQSRANERFGTSMPKDIEEIRRMLQKLAGKVEVQ